MRAGTWTNTCSNLPLGLWCLVVGSLPVVLKIDNASIAPTKFPVARGLGLVPSRGPKLVDCVFFIHLVLVCEKSSI